jgi:hypothetical protein
MLEHPLAVLDLAPAEAPGIGTVQPRRMAFEAHAVETFVAGVALRTYRAQRETNDHEDHDSGMP